MYLVNDIYLTIHGEGRRYGIPHVFVRFALCNLTCSFCDTEYESYTEMTGEDIYARAVELTKDFHVPPEKTRSGAVVKGESTVIPRPCRNVLFCGGEPLLQLDKELLGLFSHWFTVVETNGTCAIPEGLDWVTCSPKVAEHAIVPDHVQELKYVRGINQPIPRPRCQADNYLISPMFMATDVPNDVIQWCIKLVLENPQWALTVQHQKVSYGDLK